MQKLSGTNQWQGSLLRGQRQRLSFQVKVTESPTILQAQLYVLVNGKEHLAAQDAYTDTTVNVIQVTRQVLSDPAIDISLQHSSASSGKSESRRIVEYRLD